MKVTRHTFFTPRPQWTVLWAVCLALAAGCVDPFDDDGTMIRPKETIRIVRVDVAPNPVAAGDSLTLRCVTLDSLATGYEYAWGLPAGFRYTTNPIIRVKAPDTPGNYEYGVTVRNDEPNTSFPTKIFIITVIP